MTNIEKIKAEIEKRRELIKAYCLNPNHDKRYDVVPEQLAYILSFIDSLPEEKPGEPGISDLEKATEEYRQGEVDTGCDYIDDSDGDSLYLSFCLTDAFIAGAERQRVEMMKDAVEAEITVGRLPDDLSLAYNPDELHRALLKFKSGDKVKIIIVKQ